MKLNEKGYRHARSLIKAGKVDESSSWSFSAEDGNRLLGDPPNWEEFGRWHLGIREDEDPETKKHWAYPFGKNGSSTVRRFGPSALGRPSKTTPTSSRPLVASLPNSTRTRRKTAPGR